MCIVFKLKLKHKLLPQSLQRAQSDRAKLESIPVAKDLRCGTMRHKEATHKHTHTHTERETRLHSGNSSAASIHIHQFLTLSSSGCLRLSISISLGFGLSLSTTFVAQWQLSWISLLEGAGTSCSDYCLPLEDANRGGRRWWW